MGPISIRFNVTNGLPAGVTDGRNITIAAWLFWPDDLTLLGKRPVTMTLLNGGSYDKRYFHVQLPGRSGYSAAEHLAARGNIVLLTDHLGVGESSRLASQKKGTRQIAALANKLAVSQFYDRLTAGELHPLLPSIRDFAKFGGGHSMGGMQTIVQQAEYPIYDAVMILGYTAVGVHLTMGGKRLRAADLIPPGESPDYSANDRAPMHEIFHWEDVPQDVVAADDALAVETPAGIGMDSIRTRIVANDAARITVPVYICLGERDVSPNPHAEPAYYRNSMDIMLHILPKSGHCQNFAGTRHQMWDRMHHWAQCVAVR
jgi:pimeloyl-ACP methyl ester carboxylesterase